MNITWSFVKHSFFHTPRTLCLSFLGLDFLIFNNTLWQGAPPLTHLRSGWHISLCRIDHTCNYFWYFIFLPDSVMSKYNIWHYLVNTYWMNILPLRTEGISMFLAFKSYYVKYQHVSTHIYFNYQHKPIWDNILVLTEISGTLKFSSLRIKNDYSTYLKRNWTIKQMWKYLRN